MPRSCIGKVFAVVLATPQTAQKIAYMRGSGSDDIESQKTPLLTKSLQLRHAQYTQLNSCHRRHSAKEAYSALRDSAKMSGNSYELMKSMKSPTILECGSFRLMRYILWKSAGASVIGNAHHVIKGVNQNGVHHNRHIVRMGRNERRKRKLIVKAANHIEFFHP